MPDSAASMSASTMGESPDVRYSVCLIARTSGSVAACSRNACTEVEKESYGWWSRTSLVRRAAKMSGADADSTSARSRWVPATNFGYFSSGRSRLWMRKRPVRSSGPGSG